VIELVNRPLVRLLMVGLPVLALQTTIVADLPVAGVVAQVVLVCAAAAGVTAGPERGALAGFVLGLMFDLVLTSPLGLTALVYGLAGYLAGYINSLTVEHPWWLVVVVVGSASALSTLAQPVLANLVGVEGWLTIHLVRVVVVVSLVNAVLAPLVVPLMRWTLRIPSARRLRVAPEAS
jgi:rod shape-determining protein MreD